MTQDRLVEILSNMTNSVRPSNVADELDSTPVAGAPVGPPTTTTDDVAERERPRRNGRQADRRRPSRDSTHISWLDVIFEP